MSSTSVDFFSLHVHLFGSVSKFLQKRGVESLYGSTEDEVRTYFSADYVRDIKLLQVKQLNICLDLAKPAAQRLGLAALP